MSTVAPAWHDLLAGEELAHLTVEPARTGRSEPFPDDLDPRVASALVAQGITSLYTHQAETWEALRAGGNAIVTTSTASGKSLAFNLPVLDLLAREPKSRALYLYPTKALSQDQARALGAFGVKGVKPAIYDGDTETERRWQIRRWANVILTNPDMLHVGVLPHHDRWGDVLANLRYVVVDEAHVYRGVFGSHVSNVLRRLRRLARAYDSEPQFVLASATIANAAQLAQSLLGEPAVVVDSDAAPATERTIALWNPELIDEDLGQRASALGDASRLLATFVERGLRTICFAKSRKAVELIHRFASDRLEPELAARLAPYRAGYTPSQRREIEQRLMAGELLGVSATDALELGIDIGTLDCAISVGFPGTVSSLRQQWGRAGRRSPGLAVLVASEDALDQYFMREPETLLGRTVEAALLDHANPRVLDGHVLSAAFEGPIDEADAATLGPEALERAAVLPELKKTDAGYVWAGTDYPAARVLLRSGELDSFTVVDAETGAVLGLVERSRAYSTVHDGAVYLHLGEQHVVKRLDVDGSGRARRPRERRLVHAGEEGDADLDRGAAAGRAPPRARAPPRPRLGHRAGDRVPAQVDQRRRHARDGPARPAGDELRDRGGLVLSHGRPARGSRGDAEAAVLAPRGRALADRAPPALGDVRPLGHRRPLDERALPDRSADDLRLRRPRRRRRDHGARLRALRGLGRGHGEDARRLPVLGRLPQLRAEPEVRQPERLSRQGRRADAPPQLLAS